MVTSASFQSSLFIIHGQWKFYDQRIFLGNEKFGQAHMIELYVRIFSPHM